MEPLLLLYIYIKSIKTLYTLLSTIVRRYSAATQHYSIMIFYILTLQQREREYINIFLQQAFFVSTPQSSTKISSTEGQKPDFTSMHFTTNSASASKYAWWDFCSFEEQSQVHRMRCASVSAAAPCCVTPTEPTLFRHNLSGDVHQSCAKQPWPAKLAK